MESILRFCSLDPVDAPEPLPLYDNDDKHPHSHTHSHPRRITSTEDELFRYLVSEFCHRYPTKCNDFEARFRRFVQDTFGTLVSRCSPNYQDFVDKKVAALLDAHLAQRSRGGRKRVAAPRLGNDAKSRTTKGSTELYYPPDYHQLMRGRDALVMFKERCVFCQCYH